VLQEKHAGLGERDPSRPTRTIDQALADGPLERGDLLADGRLRVSETLRGAAKRALLGDRLERGEVADLHPEEMISSTHRHKR
jgi:hypothetical protein